MWEDYELQVLGSGLSVMNRQSNLKFMALLDLGMSFSASAVSACRAVFVRLAENSPWSKWSIDIVKVY